jgi:hypothetical protein
MNLDFLSPLALVGVFLISGILLLPPILTLLEYWRTRKRINALIKQSDTRTQYWAFDLERRLLANPKYAQDTIISEMMFSNDERQKILMEFLNIYD